MGSGGSFTTFEAFGACLAVVRYGLDDKDKSAGGGCLSALRGRAGSLLHMS